MRVTNSILVSNFLSNHHTNMSKLEKLQVQIASNRKFAHIEDDPISVIYSQQANYRLQRLSQYQENVTMAQSWLTQGETAMMDLNKVITSSYESAIDAANGYENNADRNNVAQYIKQMRDQLLNTLNTSFGDKYVFGGFNTVGKTGTGGEQVPPFTMETESYVDGNGVTRERGYLCFNGVRVSDNTNPAENALLNSLSQETIKFDIGTSTDMDVTFHGLELMKINVQVGEDAMGNPIMKDTNIFDLMDDFYRCLEDDTQRDPGGLSGASLINSFVSPLQQSQNSILSSLAEVGGRTSRLDLVDSRYSQDEINYTQMKSDAEDADMEDVITRLKMAEAVYQASLAVGAQVIQPSLIDFLK